MPPLPVKLSEESQTLISSLERRHRRIVEDQISTLRRCTGPLSLQQRLGEEVKEDVAIYARQIESLDVTVDDQQGERARRELRAIVDDFRSKLADLRGDLRTALLMSKKAIDAEAKIHRHELLTFGNALSEKEKDYSTEKFSEDTLMKANADVTDALRRTIAAMQTELERSVLSTQMLESSTDTLRATSTQHDTLSSFMQTSKHLITALQKSDWLDRILLISAFTFFILVVLFILKQRFVDRGLRIALWWTKFIPDFSSDEASLKMEKGVVKVALTVASAGPSSASLVASIIPTASTIATTLSEPVLPTSTADTKSLLSASDAPDPNILVSTVLSSVLDGPPAGTVAPNPRTTTDPLPIKHIEL